MQSGALAPDLKPKENALGEEDVFFWLTTIGEVIIAIKHDFAVLDVRVSNN